MSRFWQKKSNNRVKFGLILIFLGILILTVSLDHGIRPILLQHANARAKTYANTVLNKTVQNVLREQNIVYTDIVKITRNTDDSVSSLEIDSLMVNAIKSLLIGQIQNEIANGESVRVSIPVGTLSGVDFLIGRGPSIHFTLEISSAVTAGLKSSFIAAGINQTLHRVVLHLNTQLYLIMPLYKTACNIENDFLIAETVIVGKIPDAYTNVVETPSDDIAGVLFDYSAQAS